MPPKQVCHTNPVKLNDTVMKGLQSFLLHRYKSARNRFLNFVHNSHTEMLIRLLTDPDSQGFLKETVILTPGKIKITEVCPYLIELLNDPYYNKDADQAIGEIGCKEIEARENGIGGIGDD